LRYFYTNARRRVLSLANLGLGPKAAAVVARFVHRHQCFDTVELGSNRLGDEGCRVLVNEQLFTGIPGLTNLDLSANEITPPGFVLLSNALTTSPIKDINLSTEPHGRVNRLGSEGAGALAACLRTNETLINLRLSGVGGAGFSKLARYGLSQCGDTSSLTSVDFSSNRLGERAFIRLCIGLVSHRIREVNFARNPFSNLAAKALCELVASSQTLLKLDLSVRNGLLLCAVCRLPILLIGSYVDLPGMQSINNIIIGSACTNSNSTSSISNRKRQ
jgi:Ran GTPase-activating protein (RanGAP) involved in mRNA processing and transport